MRISGICPLRQTHLKAFKTSYRSLATKPKEQIVLPRFTTVATLASLFKIRFPELQKQMDAMGFGDQKADHILDQESALLIADELGIKATRAEKHVDDISPLPPPADLSSCPQRPPIIGFLGHVDHGKTTLLDWFRKSHITDGEKGGITQHIGAFLTKFRAHPQQQVCFLDTPGHEAFLRLRQRGAHLTDLVLLVVASDDSVMPQTREAIKHARNAGVPMVAALTKVDRPDSDPEKAVRDLSAAGVDVEEYGGDTQCIPVSAPQDVGMEELETALLALVEVLDVRAPRDGPCEAIVVESQQLKGLGHTATVIVRRGTLKPRMTVVAGTSWARVRQLTNEQNKTLKEAGPGTPVRVTGWKELPQPGDRVLQAKDEAHAKRVVAYREREREAASEAKLVDVMNESRRQGHLEAQARAEQEERARVGLASEQNGAGETNTEEVPFVVKADVGGSAEALTDCLQGLGNDEVSASVLYQGVGSPTETDVFRAEAAGAQIIAFSCGVPRPIERLAEQRRVRIFKFDVIYKAIEAVTADLSDRMSPLVTRKVVGVAEVRQCFTITGKRGAAPTVVAGIKVSKGIIERSSPIQVMRNGKKIYDGKLASMHHGKEVITQAHKNSEYGVSFDGWSDFSEGDLLEAYQEIETPRYL